MYYDLAKGREERGMQKEVAIVRVEQLAPFPFDLIMRELRRYPKAQIMWSVPNCVSCALHKYMELPADA